MRKRLIFMLLAGGGALAAFASPSVGATDGVIHLYEISNHGPGSPGTIVVTGAINDAGVGSATGVETNSGTITLSKGSIKDVPSSSFITREEDLYGRPIHPPGCALSATITGPVKIVGGTGAYAGITGTLDVTYTLAAILPKLKSGACDTAHHTRPVGAAIFIRASGSVAFK
jgi:hypothetical protein